MKIIISPAKKMRDDIAYLAAESEPVYLQKSKILLERLRSLSYEQLKEVLACSDALAWESYERYQKMDLGKADTPALLAYVGISISIWHRRYLKQTTIHMYKSICGSCPVSTVY